MRSKGALLVFLAASCGGGAFPETDTEAGLTICANTTVEGVDVSRWDGTVDWAAVRSAGIAFAIARVSDGLAYPDSSFDANWAAIKAHGMVRGSYQYFEPAQDPIAQANLVLQRVGALGPGDLPPALDIETMGGLTSAAVAASMAQWIERIRFATGRRPIVYTSPAFWSALGNANVAADLWVANWAVTCPSVPGPFASWKLWQYSATGSVSGIAGMADRSRFNGSLAELFAWAGSGSQPDAGPGPSTTPATGCSSGAVGPSALALLMFARRRRRLCQ